jgi:hypothetical protein
MIDQSVSTTEALKKSKEGVPSSLQMALIAQLAGAALSVDIVESSRAAGGPAGGQRVSWSLVPANCRLCSRRRQDHLPNARTTAST